MIQQYKPMYSIDDVAAALCISVPMVWRKVNNRELNAVSIGRRILIRGIDLESYINSLEPIAERSQNYIVEVTDDGEHSEENTDI